MTPSFLDQVVGHSLKDFSALTAEQRAAAIRRVVPDLHFFFDQGRPFADRQAPPRTIQLATSLFHALVPIERDQNARTLDQRIITDGLLRSEADRDQNVYLGRLFTRVLTQAEPDLIFQPTTMTECALALRWAADNRIPVTLRGAASTAMGGSVPADGGLTLDLSRLDSIDVDLDDKVAVIGAGARLRVIHQRLAERGMALRSYPSNLGGTLIGWFLTGGVGLNAFSRGRALDSVKAADVLLPSGEHVRFHAGGRLDIPDGRHRRTLTAPEAAEWFKARRCAPFGLTDLAGSEGTLGLVLHITVAIEERPTFGAFLLAFDSERDALDGAAWVAANAAKRAAPANMKFFSGSHMHHTLTVWEDEASRDWKRAPSTLSSGATLPWRGIVGPAELGAETSADSGHAGAYLFVDFAGLDAARSFAHALRDCPGRPCVLGEESVRFAAERFRPQQTKRLGPGLLASEILLPAGELLTFLPKARRLARAAGATLDAEVYYLADGTALVIAGYLTDARSGALAMDLVLAPALLDLAQHHRGRPYVLGRWQAPYFARKQDSEETRRLRAIRRALDPADLTSRGVRFRMGLRGPLGWLVSSTMLPGVSLLRGMLMSFVGPLVGRALRAVTAGFPGPARGRGEPALVGAPFRASSPLEPAAAASSSPQAAAARALHCVNCGECNSVCPIFHESAIRLPQMLTHLGEATYAGQSMPLSGSVLLDLCMRCGNCEEVCQAGIPHLPLYEVMQGASDDARPPDRERHVAILSAVRGSSRYRQEFLEIRPGGYQKRAAASLPGVQRYLLMRAENDAGPAATCIHCGACVPVCPTGANLELQGKDTRWITTDQSRCIGCGTCVEVCPANLANEGQTLRVMEAPAPEWFVALEALEGTTKP